MSISTYVRKRLRSPQPKISPEGNCLIEGWSAFYRNLDVSNSPYSEDLPEHKQWLEGYRNAQWDYELETELEEEEEYENYDEDELY